MSIKGLGPIILICLAAGILCGCTITIKINSTPSREGASPGYPGSIETDEELLERAENARTVNPWGETQSLSVASEWAGFDFYPPSEEIALGSGRIISLTTYRYMTGVAEALYKTDDLELVFRQSRDIEGIELAGDPDTYSSAWDENIDGITVHCLGDGKNISLAYYDSGEDHFSVMFSSGTEGDGLTSYDLSGIISE